MPELSPAIAALIKVFSLGYLLTLIGLGTAALLWRLIRPRVAPALRADAGFALLAGTWLLNTLLAGGIWWGVVNYKILMTTNHFHHLMYGGWGSGITGTGLMVCGVSLMLLAWGWQRGTVPQRLQDCPQAGFSAAGHSRPLPVRAASGVATAALVGVIRPEIWVNPDYWQGLSSAERELALEHELTHQRRGDNLRKLLLACIGGLFAILPGARSWAGRYEQDSELAVDDRCRRRHDEQAYRSLIAGALEFLLQRPHPAAAQPPGRAALAVHELPVQSSLGSAPRRRGGLGELLFSRSGLSDSDPRYSRRSHAALLERLRLLAQPRLAMTAAAAASVMLLAVLLGMLCSAHSVALLTHPVPRCLLACYLGY